MTDLPAWNTGAHFVYAELQRQILSLELKPGERIFEPAMASSLRVSRTPLREAIRRLISENLLEQQPTGGVLVPSLNEAVISELYEVRAAMESLMARDAAVVEFADDAMRQGMALHSRLAEIAGNPGPAVSMTKCQTTWSGTGTSPTAPRNGVTKPWSSTGHATAAGRASAAKAPRPAQDPAEQG